MRNLSVAPDEQLYLNAASTSFEERLNLIMIGDAEFSLVKNLSVTICFNVALKCILMKGIPAVIMLF